VAIWLYMATGRVGTPEAVRRLAREGGLWVPGNLARPYVQRVHPGDHLLVFWRRVREETSGVLLGGARVAEPPRAWGRSTWLATVSSDEGLCRLARELGYRGPRNYMTMALLDAWTEDGPELQDRLRDERPRLRLEPGARYAGLPASALLGPLPAEGLPRREENDVPLLSRITIDPGIYGGKPVIRGLRIAVEHVLGWMEHGASEQEILEAFPFLEPEDVRACLAYARHMVGNETIHPRIRVS